ncbi:MAG: hypothetical protein QXG03_09650 [Halalkalicoccus sp.]
MEAKTDPAASPAEEEAIADLDTVVRTLSKSGRRSVLEHLCDRTGPIPAADLAAAVASGGDDDAETVFRTLRHVHLPKLTEAGLIEYDRATETATATETGRRALSSLDRLPQ